MGVAKMVYKLHASGRMAFVVDDSIKLRRSKFMDGVSSHYDHVTNQFVIGQQVVSLGLCCDKGYIALDSEVSVSSSRVQQNNSKARDLSAAQIFQTVAKAMWQKVTVYGSS